MAKPWDVEEDKQRDGNKDMEKSVKSKEDEQQKEVEMEDELRYFTPRAKLDVYGNEFLSVESAEEEPSEDMIKEPPDKKPPINISTAPLKRTKPRGSDGQYGSKKWFCGCHDCILTLLKQGELKQGKIVSTLLIDLIKRHHKVGQGTSKNRHLIIIIMKIITKMLIDLIKRHHKVGHGRGKNRHPEMCVCVYHIDEWRNRPYI